MSTARNSRFEVRGGSELEVCSIQSLEAALRGVDAKFLVDLKFGDCIRSWRLEVRGSLPLGFEVRSIQSLGVAEEGVDAKFDVKRAEIKQRRLPKYLRESTIFLPESKSKAEGSASTSRLNLNSPIPPICGSNFAIPVTSSRIDALSTTPQGKYRNMSTY